jgi:hypothetical protein
VGEAHILLDWINTSSGILLSTVGDVFVNGETNWAMHKTVEYKKYSHERQYPLN